MTFFAAVQNVRFWHKTSAGDVCSDVGDWMMNGHIAGSAFRSRLTQGGHRGIRRHPFSRDPEQVEQVVQWKLGQMPERCF